MIRLPVLKMAFLGNKWIRFKEGGLAHDWGGARNALFQDGGDRGKVSQNGCSADIVYPYSKWCQPTTVADEVRLLCSYDESPPTPQKDSSTLSFKVKVCFPSLSYSASKSRERFPLIKMALLAAL